MPGILSDARFAARALWRHRTFTAAVVLTLAVGFGATSAVFSIYRAALLRPVAVSDPARLVFVHRYETRRGYYSSSSYPAFVEYRARAAGLVALAAYTTGSAPLEDRGTRRLVSAVMASEGYFDVARVTPLRGRVPAGGERLHAAVIGERLWTDAFGRDDSAVGRAIVVGGRPMTIVGVLPRSFAGFDRETRADLWVPLESAESFREAIDQWGRDWLELVGRLRPGVSREQAESALGAASATLPTGRPEAEAIWRLQLSPGARGNIYPHVRERTLDLLWLVSAAAGLLLVVTCATAVNLSIARMQSRARELRIRVAVGAEARHLLRLLALEHTLLAVAGAAAGGLLASWIPAAFAAYTLPGSVRIADLALRFDAAHAAFAAGLVLLVGGVLTAFTVPAWRRRRAILRLEGAHVTRRLLVRRSLVAAQVAMSLALVFSGGLLFKALRSQIDLDPAFRAQQVIMATIDVPRSPDGTPGLGEAVFRSIRDRTTATPGVVSASWSFILPFGARRMQVALTPLDAAAEPPPGLDANIVDVGYFETLGVPIVGGRAFAEADREGSERVVIVTESLARRYWPDREPTGQRLAGRAAGVTWTIVGVVPDELHYDIRSLRGGRREHVFFPLAQMYRAFPPSSLTLLVRAERNPMALAGQVRTILAEEAPAAEPAITTARRHVDSALSQEWLAASTAGAIAAVALALAAIGLFGLLRYTVAERTREFAIRRALGAPGRALLRVTLADAALTLVPGGLLGIAAAWPLARTISPLLHGVRPLDGAVLAVAVGVTVVAALAAVWLPARAAARIEPAEALRLD